MSSQQITLPGPGALVTSDADATIFDMASDALVAALAFEVSTGDSYQYEARAMIRFVGDERELAYQIRVKDLDGFTVGYLKVAATENPRAFSVYGYADAEATGHPGFAAYSPTREAADGDLAAYRDSRPDLKAWRIADNAPEAS